MSSAFVQADWAVNQSCAVVRCALSDLTDQMSLENNSKGEDILIETILKSTWL